MGGCVSQGVDRGTIFFMAVLLAGAVLLGWQEASDQEVLPAHSEAPVFIAERIDGSMLDLTSLRGQVVVVNFWATWCPPCRAELPYLIDTVNAYSGQGVRLVAVNNDDLAEQREAVTSFLGAFPELKPFAVFGRPEIGEDYQVRALPSVYVIDRHGHISASYEGQASETQLRRWIDGALKN